MSFDYHSAGRSDSAQVRSQLVTALEIDLIGPTQRVLKALGADASGLETEALDRLPSSWYLTGFLSIPPPAIPPTPLSSRASKALASATTNSDPS
jgi:hypothetical protein